jgi:hypothetical protein
LTPWRIKNLAQTAKKGRGMEFFSLSDTLLKDLLHFAKPFGHREDARSLNLGFGFLYYALVRALRPKHTLVIGSGYGFSVGRVHEG